MDTGPWWNQWLHRDDVVLQAAFDLSSRAGEPLPYHMFASLAHTHKIVKIVNLTWPWHSDMLALT